MEIKNRPAAVLAGIAVIAVLVAVAVWGIASSNLFRTYNLSGGFDGGISPLFALIPAVIAVIAAIGAGVIWATSRAS